MEDNSDVLKKLESGLFHDKEKIYNTDNELMFEIIYKKNGKVVGVKSAYDKHQEQLKAKKTATCAFLIGISISAGIVAGSIIKNMQSKDNSDDSGIVQEQSEEIMEDTWEYTDEYKIGYRESIPADTDRVKWVLQGYEREQGTTTMSDHQYVIYRKMINRALINTPEEKGMVK